jgi:kynurenine formamidase
LNRIVDFTRPIEHGMPIYPGEPEVIFEYRQTGPYATVAVSLSSHSGTSADLPRHVFPQGATLDEYPIEKWSSHGGVLFVDRLEAKAVITREQIEAALSHTSSFLNGGFLFIHTGWDSYWKDDTYFKHPYLSLEAALWLVDQGVALVGMDTPNTDATWNEADEVHRALLGNDVIVVENLCGLDQLASLIDGGNFVALKELWVVPLLLSGADGAPVRVFAKID